MAFQAVPNTFELIFNWTLNGQLCVTTFYAEVDPGDYTALVAADILSEFAGWVQSDLLPIFPQEVLGGLCVLRGLANAADYFLTNVAVQGDPGGTGTGNYSGNVAYSVKRGTGLTGRSQRGRVYIPVPVGSLATDENQVSTTWRDNLLAALNSLGTALAAAGATEVIVSRFLDGAARTTGIPFGPLVYTAVDTYVDSMRRRLTNRGT